MNKKFPFYKQMDQADCGPTCLRMIAKHYGKSYTLEHIRERSYITRSGVSLLGLSEAAQSIGLRSLSVSITFDRLEAEAPLPCIAHWKNRHFVVIYKIKKDKIYVADPGYGLITYSKEEFIDAWIGNNTNKDTGTILLLEKTPEFEISEQKDGKDKISLGYIFGYIRPYKKFVLQLALGMLIGSFLMLIFPFLTQSIVDRGIAYQDVNFIYLILAGQLLLFAGSTVVQFIQSWIVLHVSSRINISLISDFLAKLMRLPISYFESRVVGDILQRISDHDRIQDFMTTDSLSVLFSTFNFIVFGFLMAYFDMKIFLVFMISTVLYVFWIFVFLKKREELDYRSFDQMSKDQSNIVELITAMKDIKLNNAEHQKRWEWEKIQAKLYKISIDSLKLGQYQEIGSFFIGNLKDILITFFSAKAVIDGHMTLGTMLAVQYIVGQANGPLGDLLGFITSAQDAKISLDRLNEVRNKEDEESPGIPKIRSLPTNRDIVIKGVDFRYGPVGMDLVLDNIDLTIPEGKITAIVGASGSGKTTLLKLLLKFFNPIKGTVHLGKTNLNNYHSGWWRSMCGTVMQEGHIYSDTIAKNITVGDEFIDYERMMHAVEVANIQEFIESLPLSYQTVIGQEGVSISQGQKQRLLIARAVYKDPEYLFFDEATNALDTNNERVIMENLDRFFEGRTVLVVAHRLSTVKNADNIVVLDAGKIVEEGTHQELANKRGYYYNLVKNQIDLGS